MASVAETAPIPAQEQLRGHAAMALFSALISGSFTLGGMAAPFIDPTAMNASRFVLGAAFLAGIALAQGRFDALTERRHYAAPWRYALLGGLFGAYFILMFTALRIAKPAPLGAVFTLAPLMSAGFSWAIYRQTTRLGVLLPLLLGGCGAIWVIFRGDIDAILGMDIGRGEAIFFFGVICHALFASMVRPLSRDAPVAVSTFATLFAAAVLLTLYGAPALLATDWSALPFIVWVTLGYLAIFTTATTSTLLQFASRRLPAPKVMAYTYLTPCYVIVLEGLIGHGWVPMAVLPGVIASLGALWLLMREGS